MDDACAGGHPLHVARSYFAASAAGIAMLNFAAVENGDGLKAAMRMFANSTARV